MRPTSISPMKTAGTQHLIERTYRESGIYQWVRETYKNAEEAGATRLEYGVEWQAVQNLGVYRRVISDNGRGMTADQLREFFNTFGGGGKPIGGAHENFGVGAKTSLLPWNRYGMVVISWVSSDASMIWVQRDPDSGEYGLRIVEAEDPDTEDMSLETVYEPFYDDEHGCDWSRIKPHWIQEHGTVIVLLGNDPREDTVLGDQNREERDIKGISSYLNRRIWEVPRNLELVVDELRTVEKGEWPRSEEEAHGPIPKKGSDRRTNRRTIRGARYYIEYPEKNFKSGQLGASGTVVMEKGSEIDWYLWKGERPAVQSYAAIGGYIATLYRNELFDVTSHNTTYRSFGISESSVRSNVWLIIRPVELDKTGKEGVYPRTDRNSLLMKGGPRAGEPLPVNSWAAEFADQMPDEIREAIRVSRSDHEGTLSDPTWRERLAERFGSRWRIAKLRAAKGGFFTIAVTQPGSIPRSRPKVKKPRIRTNEGGNGGNGGRGGQPVIGMSPGTTPAIKKKVAGGIPHFRAVKASDVDPGILAAWKPNDPDHPEGVVLLNVEHPVLRSQIEYWQAQYPDHVSEGICHEVVESYGQIAVAKVAHSEHLKTILPSERVDNELRSDAALTMSLLGLIAEEAVIATRVGGRFGRRRASNLTSAEP